MNSANSNMKHGRGISGLILKEAGFTIQEEAFKYIKKNGPVPVGQCCVSDAGKLGCNKIIHTVGPIYKIY